MRSTGHPFVSLILPIRNEGAHIQRCLEAVLDQDYPSDRMEILVVDGMSTDGTREMVQEIIAKQEKPDKRSSVSRSPSPVILLDNPSGIVPSAMNIGLRQAEGDIIIRVDGHTVIAPDYVRRCVEALERTEADSVGGRMNAAGTGAFGRAVALATSSPFGVGGARFHYSDKEEWVDTVYMGAWPRRVFDTIELFDEELVRDQDDEFNYRLRGHEGRILLSPAIRSEYNVRSTPRALFRQYFQYGYWKVRVLQKHPRQMRMRQFVPPLFVLALGLSALCAVSPLLRSLSPVVPVLYLCASLSASLLAAARRGWRAFPLLPVVFAILHLSYGLGFLVGLVRFANRWGDRRGRVPEFKPVS